MDPGPHQEDEERSATVEDERIELGHVASFAGGTICCACGATGARPAKPALAESFNRDSKSAEEYAHRVALCAKCADLQRAATERERALSWLALGCVGPMMLAALAPATPSLALVAAATFGSAVVLWLVFRRLTEQAPLAAVVLAVERDQMRVWLSRAPERCNQRPKRALEFGDRFGWTAGAVFIAAVPLWFSANPRVEFELVDVAGLQLAINGQRTEDIHSGSWTRLAFGINRIDFVSSSAIPPLEIRRFLSGSVGVRVSIPVCDERDDAGDPRPHRLEWQMHTPSLFELRCRYQPRTGN